MTNIVVQKDLSDYLSGTGYLYSSFPYSKLTLSAIT